MATVLGSVRDELDPAAAGLRFQRLKEASLRASAGATDFSGLFIGFSMFLIGAAAMLAGLLFRLGVEQRAAEIGLLLAVGFPVRAVRRRFLAEGGSIAAAGALLGLAGGVGYAWLMMAGLRTLWLPAVGTPYLFLHVGTMSLALGWIVSVGVVLASIAGSVRHLGRVPSARLLAGTLCAPESLRRAGRLARLAAYGCLALAAAMVLTSVATGAFSSPALA